MRPSTAFPTSHAARIVAVAAVGLALAAATWTSANAATPASPVIPADAPALSASIESSATAFAVESDFGYTVHIRLAQPASYLQTRIRVRRPSGRLVFQRTKVENALSSGDHAASFGRTLQGLSLAPGSYPVEIEVRADIEGSTVTTELATNLLVFDPAEQPAGTVIVARINSQPLEAPDGRVAIDPAVATKARDDVTTIATLILADPVARVTLSVPPMLLAQWKRIADGYQLSDGREVPAEDPTAVSYAAALDLLGQAVETGRLELLWTGFADPDIAQLASEGLTRDVTPHYQEGISATYASLETSPSTGTALAGVCVPPSALSALRLLGIGYVVEDAGCARSGDSTVTSGAYPVVSSSLRALLSDQIASDALSSADTSTAINRIAARQIGTPSQPVVVLLELTDGGPTAGATVVPLLRTLATQLWTRPLLGRDTTPPNGTRSVRLLADRVGSAAPRSYWTAVSRARVYAMALMASLGPSDSDAISAQQNSFIAESAAWSSPDGSWAEAGRGQQFAAAAYKTAREILDTVGIAIEPITLPSARGEVPVSLQNGTGKTLYVTVRTSTSGGIEVVGPNVTETVVRPQETFVKIPVNMHSSLSGKLTVEVLAGTLVLSERTVTVRASYLDRLVIIGGIVLALGILLAFIVRRVRAAEQAEVAAASGADDDERYTDDSTDTDGDPDNA